MSDSTNRNESITEVLPKALGQYLLDEVDALREYYEEFPAPNRTINLPSISLFLGPLEFTPQAEPNLVKAPAAIDPPTPDGGTQNRPRVKWIVGQYDATLQLDLWTGSKEERDDLTDALFNALNPNIKSGLTLELDEYFNVLCDYLYVGSVFEDSEISAQTDQWRTKFDILVTCKAVRERKEYVIEQSEVVVETSTTNQSDPFIPAKEP